MKNTPNWKDYYTDKKVINIANRLTTKLLQLNIKSRQVKDSTSLQTVVTIPIIAYHVPSPHEQPIDFLDVEKLSSVDLVWSAR